MRRWTVVAGLYVTLFALLGLASTSFREIQRGQRPVAAGREVSADSLDTLRLIVGDTIDLALRPGRPPAVMMALGPVRAPGQFASDSPSVASVTAAGRVVAARAGTARITATMDDTGGMRAAVVIQVLTPRQAANVVAMEVCPNDDERYVMRDLPVPEDVPAIHEFHDCQRLIVGDTYSAVVGIFANANAMKWRRWNDYRSGRMAATIINFVGKDTPTVYPALRIAPGTNCLVLKADRPESWQAAILHQASRVVTVDGGRRYATCDGELTWADVPDSAKRRLVVYRQKGVDMKGRRKAPPVARWDWDRVNRINYIGVSCDAETWCEIGPPQFTRSIPLTRRNSHLHGRVDTILKGYYDQQFLADSTGRRPSTVFGTIAPGRDAGDAADMDYDRPRWYHVAQIDLEETAATASAEYARYVKDYAGVPANGGRLERMTRSRYELHPDHQSTKGKRGVYRGRFNQLDIPADSIVYRWHSHLEGMVPTVRWRWVDTDERTWTYCDPEGCCENQSGLK